MFFQGFLGATNCVTIIFNQKFLKTFEKRQNRGSGFMLPFPVVVFIQNFMVLTINICNISHFVNWGYKNLNRYRLKSKLIYFRKWKDP